MEYIYMILGLLSLFFIGYAPVYFLLPGKGGFKVGSRSVSGGVFIFFLSFFIGALMAGWVLTVLSLFDISFGAEIIYGLSAVFFVFYIYNFLSVRFRSSERKSINRLDRDIVIARERSRNKNKAVPEDEKEKIPEKIDGATEVRQRESTASRAVFIVFAALIILNFAAVVFLTIIFPIRFWDAISCWSLKGKAFFIDGIINNFYTGHDYGFSHLSYPLYLPLIQTWLLSWMGEINENILKIIFPVFYSSLLFSLYYLFRQRLGKASFDNICIYNILSSDNSGPRIYRIYQPPVFGHHAACSIFLLPFSDHERKDDLPYNISQYSFPYWRLPGARG